MAGNFSLCKAQTGQVKNYDRSMSKVAISSCLIPFLEDFWGKLRTITSASRRNFGFAEPTKILLQQNNFLLLITSTKHFVELTGHCHSKS